jgi:dihydrofolate reductase
LKLIIIAAIGKNRVIGKGGKIPWHISEDLKRFKRLTTGHVVLMGRKTFESIGRSLPNRRNVVITSRPIPGVETFGTVELALKSLVDEEMVFVIGGGQIYSQLLEKADELHLTLVDTEIEGDTSFPPYEELMDSSFTLTEEEQRDGFRFLHYVRKVDPHKN